MTYITLGQSSRKASRALNKKRVYLAGSKVVLAIRTSNSLNIGDELELLLATRLGSENANHVSPDYKGHVVLVSDGKLRVLSLGLWLGTLLLLLGFVFVGLCEKERKRR
jgi:hypothetical protein